MRADDASTGFTPADFAPTDFAPTDFAGGLERAFALVPEEGAHRLRAEGRLPRGLAGTWYLNGPARFSRGERRYCHWLDGDGMVARLRFERDGGLSFANRFVRSAKLCGEEESGRARFRAFGTAWEGDELLRGVMLASPVNVSLYPFAGRLLAFGEQGLPWELDPITLETRGEHTFGRKLTAVSPFSAHPKIDLASGEMLNFGVSFAAAEPSLTLYRFDREGGLIYRRRHALSSPMSIHDFGVSSRFCAVYANPYLLDTERFLRGGASVQEALDWRPERGSEMLIFERASGDLVATVPLGEGYCLHHIHAGEDGARLVVDLIEMSEPVYPDYQPLPELFVDVAPARPVRLVIDLGAARLAERIAMPLGWSADFPATDPRQAHARCDDFWMLAISATGRRGRKFLDRIVRGDWRQAAIVGQWSAPSGCYLAGEPVFLPAAGDPRAGHLLVPQLDTGRMETRLLLFDAFDLEGGPVAEIPLPSPLHLGFHTHFQPD